jgi:heat shock protein HslJ
MKWSILFVLLFLTINLSAQQTLTDKKWVLVELKGKPVADFGKVGKEPLIQFFTKEMQFAGTGGCNSFRGTYSLKDKNEIKFSKIASTLMICPNMQLEEALLNVLNSADKFIVTADSLILHKAKMAPLAKFVAVSTQ